MELSRKTMMLKEHALNALTKAARFLLTDTATRFEFIQPQTLTLPNTHQASLYVHIPFCHQLCPYCPYNRIRYTKEFIAPFVSALLKEIQFYSTQLPQVEITSIYFGGGTPTVLGTDLERIILAIRNAFRVCGPFCIETNPGDLTQEKVHLLRSFGVDTISVGVQSFHPRHLNLLGRTYTPETIHQVLSWVTKANFATVNIDLLFALPEQTVQDLETDIIQTMAYAIDQLTAYPLFTFPYSTVGEYTRLKQVVMPSLSLRREMYYFLYDYLIQQNYRRVSVWSFARCPEIQRYSSVTRERFIGLGPGAGSYFESLFTLNTFSIPQYIASVQQRGEAVALLMPFTRILSIMYDFYWRIYDTYIPFSRELEQTTYSIFSIKRLNALVTLARLLGFVSRTDTHFELTRKGALWVHWLQNHFSLKYINTIWTRARREAWPQSITF